MIVKFYSSILILFCASTLILKAAEIDDNLALADSLFSQGKYTESYQHYNNIFFDQSRYTPQMLLKMAFITEGLEEYDKALFFLNRYYRDTFDDMALDKMQRLSEAQALTGYDRDDLGYLLDNISKYYFEIVQVLIVLQACLLIIVAYKKFKLKSQPMYSWISSAIVSIVLLLVLNLAGGRQEAIIIKDNSYLMKGPSAGADLIAITEKGHKVEVIRDGEVWSEIRINDNPAFIRSNHLLRF